MRFLFVRANLHDSTAAIPRALSACRSLAKEIDVVCWNRSGDNLPSNETNGTVTIHRFNHKVPPRSVASIVLLLCFQIWVIYQILKTRPDVVQALDFESVLPVCLMRAVARFTIIYDMRDPFADSYSFQAILRWLAYGLDWLAMGCCDAFVVPADDRLDYLGCWGRKRPVCVLINTCHDDLADLPADSGIGERPAHDVIRIGFFGYLVPARGSRMLFDLVRSGDGKIELYVAGICRCEGLLAEANATKGVHYFGKVTRLRALAMMRDVDLVAMLYDPSIPVNRIAAPNKFYEAICVGTPILVSKGMGIGKTVRCAGLGWEVEYSNSAQLRDFLRNLSRDAIENSGLRCREYFLAHCDLSQRLQEYTAFYSRVTEVSARP